MFTLVVFVMSSIFIKLIKEVVKSLLFLVFQQDDLFLSESELNRAGLRSLDPLLGLLKVWQVLSLKNCVRNDYDSSSIWNVCILTL